MHICNSLVNTVRHYSHEVRELYKYRPPLYDIAVGIIRGMTPATAIGLMFLAGGVFERNSTKTIIATSLLAYGFEAIEIASLINHSRLNRLCRNQNHKKVVLFLEPTSDLFGGATRLHHKTFKILQDLSSTHSIVTKKVSTIHDINDAIREIKKKGSQISTLWINAHGSWAHLNFGSHPKNGRINLSNFSLVAWKQLDKPADIVLGSCSSGESIKGGINIADLIQIVAGPMRRVHAPSGTFPYDGTYLDRSKKKVSYGFRNMWGMDITSDISFK